MIDPEKTKLNKLNNIKTYEKGVHNNIGVGYLNKKLHPGR